MAPILVLLLGAAVIVTAEFLVPLHGGLAALLLVAAFIVWGDLPTDHWTQDWLWLALLALFWLALVFLTSLRDRRRRALLGGAELIGVSGTVLALGPPLQIRLRGELWQARAQQPLGIGARVRVRAVHGLTLDVELEDRDPEELPVGPRQS